MYTTLVHIILDICLRRAHKRTHACNRTRIILPTNKFHGDPVTGNERTCIFPCIIYLPAIFRMHKM